MNYNQFKKSLLKEVKACLPEEYQSWKLECRDVAKVNGYKEGINLMPEGDHMVSPTLYVDDLYQCHKNGESVKKVARKTAEAFVEGINMLSRIHMEECLTLPKEQIVYCLINAEGNQRLLENVPHRITMDMALIYRVVLMQGNNGINSTIITHDLASYMDMTEEELYQAATENTARVLPADVYYCERDFVIMTNQYKLLGATVMMYPGELKAVAEHLESDLYILPSSIHEVFLIPAREFNIESINHTIVEANKAVVEKEDILAYHAYYYDRNNDMVSIAV